MLEGLSSAPSLLLPRHFKADFSHSLIVSHQNFWIVQCGVTRRCSLYTYFGRKFETLVKLEEISKNDPKSRSHVRFDPFAMNFILCKSTRRGDSNDTKIISLRQLVVEIWRSEDWPRKIGRRARARGFARFTEISNNWPHCSCQCQHENGVGYKVVIYK